MEREIMKLYLIGGVIIALIAFSGFTYRFGYKAGADSVQVSMDKARAKMRDEENKRIEAVQKAQKDREVKYRERLKILEKSRDACLDRNVPDDYLGLYPNLGGKGKAERGTH